MKTRQSVPQELTSKIIGCYQRENLWLSHPTKLTEKKALTDIGRNLISRSVQACLKSGLVPLCSVNGDDGTADNNVVSLSPTELRDLINGLDQIK